MTGLTSLIAKFKECMEDSTNAMMKVMDNSRRDVDGDESNERSPPGQKLCFQWAIWDL
jgi:hypothetical protein